MKIVDSSSLNSSACTITPGLGRPSSLGTTTSTTSPRFTSRRSNHKPPQSTHRWHRFPDAAPSFLPVGANQPAPWDRKDQGLVANALRRYSAALILRAPGRPAFFQSPGARTLL